MSAATLPWDYTRLARHYETRAPYHADTAAHVAALVMLPTPARIADIGAGTGRAARLFAAAGHGVDAVEPNDAMRAIGVELTRDDADVRWHDARGEATRLAASAYDLVTFGSSFNVVDARAALDECARLLRPTGALACFWNHRDLDEPLQASIEAAIRRVLPHFDPGARREDPTATIAGHGAFEAPRAFALPFLHRTTPTAFLEGFNAHATLVRQAGADMPAILAAIAHRVGATAHLDVPFVTRGWVARRRPALSLSGLSPLPQ